MKAILVIDMPDRCEDCPLRSYSNLALVCTPLRKIKEDDDVCPLVLMPLKRETRVYWQSVGIGGIPTHEICEYDKGWNDCVDFLWSEDEH